MWGSHSPIWGLWGRYTNYLNDTRSIVQFQWAHGGGGAPKRKQKTERARLQITRVSVRMFGMKFNSVTLHTPACLHNRCPTVYVR